MELGRIAIARSISRAVRYLLSMGLLHYRLLLYALSGVSELADIVTRVIEERQDKDGSFYQSGYGRILLTADIFRTLSLIRGYKPAKRIMIHCINFLREAQLDNGLWMDYDVKLDYYRLVNDRGIAFRITLAIIEGLKNLGLDDEILANASKALLSFQEPQGYWRGTFLKEDMWDIEVTARALRILGPSMKEDRRKRAISLIKDWLIASLKMQRVDQPWALAEVLEALLVHHAISDEELSRGVYLLLDMQKPNGSWGILESNPRLTISNLLLLTKVGGLRLLEESVRTIARVKLKIMEVIKRNQRPWEEELKEELSLCGTRHRLEGIEDATKCALLRTFIWAYEESIKNREEKVPDEELPIRLFVKYLRNYEFHLLEEHAESLAKFALEEVSPYSTRYRNIGVLLRLVKEKAWEDDPIEVIKRSLILFPYLTIKAADYYVYSIHLLNLFPIPKHFIKQVLPPADNDLLLVLRKLGLISTPISIALKDYNLVRVEVHGIALELFNSAPYKLHLLSLVARRWCRSNTRCFKLTRSGYIRCPLYEACPSRRNIYEG
ncbi:MAG: hypothetical protein DRJ18_03340 [Candidatus Methanomethylicota archaeon]|nr:MAG: hypothetical protein DRJ18_03340 [Candidatus Verstraetearchaeota archaeon]